MHVAHLTLHDFRSYADVDLELGPGSTAFVGPQRAGQDQPGRGDRLPRRGSASHRVAGDAPLVRRRRRRRPWSGPRWSATAATAVLEVEINPGRSNRARVNRSPLPAAARAARPGPHACCSRPRTSPWSRATRPSAAASSTTCWCCARPRLAGVRADYDRVLKQRNTLLKTAAPRPRLAARRRVARCATLDVWDAHLARAGAELLAARLALVDELRPYVGKAYETVAARRRPATTRRRSTTSRRSSCGADADARAALGRGAARRARAPPRRRARPRRLPGRSAPRRAACSTLGTGAAGSGRATPPTASPGRSRSRCGWRRTTCCAPTATTRS